MSGKKEIIYPIFLECCQYAHDPFWEIIFDDLAYGKCPYGTYISKDFLSCSYKNKEFSYKIERKNSKQLYNDVYNLFTEKLGILSQKEKNKKKLAFHEMEMSIKESRQDWASIRKKNIKDILYRKYVIDMKNKYDLNTKQCKYLFALILIAVTFKTLTSKDIEYKNDRIISISGIVISKDEIKLEKSLWSTDSNIDGILESDHIIYTKRMSDNWAKYLRHLRKV